MHALIYKPPQGGFFNGEKMKKQQFIKQLKKLVSFETLTDNFEQNSKALDYVVSLIDKSADIKRIENQGSEMIIASNKNTKKPDIAFLVHMDVVAAKQDQFVMQIDGDRAIGRGVSDMKFSIPMGVSLLNKIIADDKSVNFSLIITTDEEMGGFKGGAFLANEYGLEPKLLIVPDGGDNLKFVQKAKGVCQLKISTLGKPAHSSRPWEGEGAIEKLVKIADLLISEYGKNSLKQNWNTTMNIGQIIGGISTNQVSASASMKIDFRYPETDSIKNIKDTVTKIAKQIDKNAEASQLSFGYPTFTDASLPVVKSFLDTMQSEVSEKIEIINTFGASDARHFAKQNVPVLMIKPIGAGLHSDDEWISIDSCMKYYLGLEKYIESYD